MGLIEETILSVVKTLALSNTIGLYDFGMSHTALQKDKRQRGAQGCEANSQQDASSARRLIVTNGRRAKYLAQFLTVIDIIHEALASNVVVSKRDIFYRDVKLFRNQSIVDKIVENISRAFNVPRSSLNVTAASKGLLFGPARLTLKNGKTIHCSDDRNTDVEYCNDEQGVLIPPISQIAQMECNADYLLVVEKEASFRHLVSTGFNTVPPKGILITGKGYPDIATRHMVRYLADSDPSLPLFALVDNDPHGLDIFRVYKWGSQVNMSFFFKKKKGKRSESLVAVCTSGMMLIHHIFEAHSFDAPNLAVPTIRLLGLTVVDRSRYNT
ncbi:Spo11/DNA topoisomerase VI subunit A [Dichotomocladium elegans]|nr:Spo11/DNA topoisomerase VI subunit A [Dichotomocladium elegans]